MTGIKFILISDPLQSGTDHILRRVYEAYADFVMKNPFHNPDMPIRCELFDLSLLRIIKQING